MQLIDYVQFIFAVHLCGPLAFNLACKIKRHILCCNFATINFQLTIKHTFFLIFFKYHIYIYNLLWPARLRRGQASLVLIAVQQPFLESDISVVDIDFGLFYFSVAEKAE